MNAWTNFSASETLNMFRSLESCDGSDYAKNSAFKSQ